MQKRVINLLCFLLCIFAFLAIVRAQTEPVAPDSLTVTARWDDENGTKPRCFGFSSEYIQQMR